jgi:iron(III) transport system ATP-binding protein
VGVTKRYSGERRSAGTVDAVHDVSFGVDPGQFFTLLGPSGCGKTTLLRSLAGLERPDAGEIWIDGKLVLGSRTWIRPEDRPIGMVFQSYAVWPHMKVFDNVAFSLVSGRQRMKPRDAAPIVTELLERVGLAEYASSWATRLSGGQQQRLALARALACRPKILLLDEPLSNLDAALRTTLRQDLKQTQRSLGVTTVYVTHDQAEALALSDQIAVMERGEIRQIGAPREVYAYPSTAFVARVVGTANIFTARVTKAGPAPEAEADFGVVPCAPGAHRERGTPVSCFIRPEKVQVTAGPRAGTGPGAGLVAGPGRFAGRVVAADFVGDRQDCTVAVGVGKETQLRGWAVADPPLLPGDPVLVTLTEPGATILGDDPSAVASTADPLEMTS